LILGAAASYLTAQEPSITTTQSWIKARVADAPLAMRFKGATAAEAQAWQAKFRAKLAELLGPHTPPASWKTLVQRSVELDDHRRDELILWHKDHPPLPVYVLVPKDAKGKKLPGVVALHGHGAHGYHPIAGRDDLPGVANAIKNANYDYGRQLAKRGCVVIAPCLTPFGPRLGQPGKDACGETFVRMQVLGKVLMAENLRDALWCVEYLAKHENVDPGRLGCVGLSYGGRMTMLTAAMEPRIGFAVVSGALNVFQERISTPYNCGAQVIPGLLQYGDVPEIGALIAPRVAVWEAGTEDKLIVQPWADEAFRRIRKVYQALGAEDKLHLDRHPGGHVWHGEVAYPLLSKTWQSK
jgi:dienelactone hydrolase